MTHCIPCGITVLLPSRSLCLQQDAHIAWGITAGPQAGRLSPSCNRLLLEESTLHMDIGRGPVHGGKGELHYCDRWAVGNWQPMDKTMTVQLTIHEFLNPHSHVNVNLHSQCLHKTESEIRFCCLLLHHSLLLLGVGFQHLISSSGLHVSSRWVISPTQPSRVEGLPPLASQQAAFFLLGLILLSAWHNYRILWKLTKNFVNAVKWDSNG